VCNLLAQRIILSTRFIAIEHSEKAELTSSLAYNILREWQKKENKCKSWKRISTLGIKNALSRLNAIIRDFFRILLFCFYKRTFIFFESSSRLLFFFFF
jgi:hypothetical protein